MRALEKACISYKNKRFGDNKVENACTRFSQLVVSWCSDWKGVRVEGSLCCFEYWMLIESHSRFIAASATSKLGIMKKVFLIVWWSGHGFEVSFELPSPSFRVLLSGLNVCWLQLLIFVFLIVWSQRQWYLVIDWWYAIWTTNIVSLHFVCFARFVVTLTMP